MKYLNTYSSNDILFEKINMVIDEYHDLIVESKFGEWLMVAPKIRRLQEKANQLRLRAVRAEAQQRREIDMASKRGTSVDTGRMWELLQNKIDAWEDTARAYEEEADRLEGGSDYLRRVRRVSRLKGVLKVNKEKIAEAEAEERRELIKNSRVIQRTIRTEETIISDKTEAERLRLELMKERMKKKDEEIASQATAKPTYFLNKKAESIRQNTAKKSQILPPELPIL